MSGARPVAAFAGTALLVGTALRLVHARGLASQMTESPPAVRTDDGVALHVEVDGPAGASLTVVFAHGSPLARRCTTSNGPRCAGGRA